MGRYYDSEAEMQQLQDDETRRKLQLDLKLYDFVLTIPELEKLLTVTENDIDIESLGGRRTSYSRRNSGDIKVVRVRKVISNARTTLRLCILANGKFLLFNRKTKPQDFGYFVTDYDLKNCNLFEDIKENMYIVIVRDWNDKWKLGCLTDAFTPEEASRWIALYKEYTNLRQDKSEYREVDALRKSSLTGEITYGRLENEMAILKATLEEVKRLDAQELVTKNAALKTVVKTPTKLEFTALDKHKYSIEVPTKRAWDMDTQWTQFIYKHRYGWSTYDQEAATKNTYFDNIMQLLMTFRDEWIKLSIDGRPQVRLSFKETQLKRGGTMQLTYIDDKRVANDTLFIALKQYFYENKALEATAVPEDVSEEERQKLKSIREQRDTMVVTHGIHGYLQDLEGECPIDIAFEKDGVKWNLTIGELKIHLKGGIETIKSIERVLKGTAQGYDSRHSTEEMYNRLCKVLTSEEAMEIIKTAKEMGKLVQSIQGKKDEL